MRRFSTFVIAALLVSIGVMVPSTLAATFFCHNPFSWGYCGGSFTVLGSDLEYRMRGDQAVAEVDSFTTPATPRNLTWNSLVMNGTIGIDEIVAASLNPSETSTGTILSLEDTEFPAAATISFFLKIETAGMTLVSVSPAVFQGTIHAVPPAIGDYLLLTGGPVAFHDITAPGVTVATLTQSTIRFTGPVPAVTEWGMVLIGLVVLIAGTLAVRGRRLTRSAGAIG